MRTLFVVGFALLVPMEVQAHGNVNILDLHLGGQRKRVELLQIADRFRALHLPSPTTT